MDVKAQGALRQGAGQVVHTGVRRLYKFDLTFSLRAQASFANSMSRLRGGGGVRGVQRDADAREREVSLT